ncbi:MAG: hypothetical protein JNK77_17615 [Saprospiraceae bacterium]|nr:hypothetical protein [Saprospiraceae bacterium]
MAILFWLLWTFDLLFAIFTLMASNFRSSMNASTTLNAVLIAVLAAVLIGGPVLRFVSKLRLLSLGVVALPVLLLITWWLVEKIVAKA